MESTTRTLGMLAMAIFLAVALSGTLTTVISAKDAAVLVEEHKDSCIEAGGSSFDSVEAGGYTMSRCTFSNGAEEICDHTTGATDCDFYPPSTRLSPSQIRFKTLAHDYRR